MNVPHIEPFLPASPLYRLQKATKKESGTFHHAVGVSLNGKLLHPGIRHVKGATQNRLVSLKALSILVGYLLLQARVRAWVGFFLNCEVARM